MSLINSVILFSSFSFLAFGIHCLKSNNMKQEFKRYGLEKFRTLTGVLEILGGLGLLVGLEFNLILKFSSLGLTLLMLAGIIVRIKIQDALIQTLPALTLFMVNLFIFFN